LVWYEVADLSSPDLAIGPVVEFPRETAMSDHWPQEIEDGLIPTDNAMGIMTREPSPAAEAFIALAATARRPLLEVGAAYGNATLPALRAGGTIVACDLSASELQILGESTPGEDRSRLVLVPARFPEELHFAEGSLGGILAAQVLHFSDGPTVERAFADAWRWLESGGKFFVVVMTPSLSYYSKFRAEYEARAGRGDRWPGIFNPRDAATPEWRDRLPTMVNLFEKDVLGRCALEAGFEIEVLEYFCFRQFPDKHRTDGREFLTMTARKRI
jgi:SAM-dependent methyltransferase